MKKTYWEPRPSAEIKDREWEWPRAARGKKWGYHLWASLCGDKIPWRDRSQDSLLISEGQASMQLPRKMRWNFQEAPAVLEWRVFRNNSYRITQQLCWGDGWASWGWAKGLACSDSNVSLWKMINTPLIMGFQVVLEKKWNSECIVWVVKTKGIFNSLLLVIRGVWGEWTLSYNLLCQLLLWSMPDCGTNTDPTEAQWIYHLVW